jgi:putative hydrolase of the HAD superfamily
MLELARRLRQHYSVGIITDNKKDRIDHLKKHLGLTALFDPIVVSAEVGSSKESSRIFERALSHLGIAPNESLFADNSEENLVAANVLGMITVHFDDEQNDVQALCETLRETYGLLVPGAA